MSSAGSARGSDFESYSQPFTVVSVIAAILGAGIAAWLFAWVYGPVEHYSPIVQLNFLLAGGMGWLIGKAARAMLRKKRIYRIGPALLVGLAGGIVGLWSSWLTYLLVISGFDFEFYWELLIHPARLWEIMKLLAVNPMWVINKTSQAESPLLYYVVWFFEAAIIIGTPVVMCHAFLKENLLCENCNEWLGATGDLAVFSLADAAGNSAVDAVKTGDLSVLSSLPRVAEGEEAPRWLEVRGYSCPNCRHLDSYVSISQGEAKEKKGKPETRIKALAHFVPIGTDMERRIFEPVPAEAASPTPAPDAAALP